MTIETLMNELELGEKVALLAGADLWHTTAIPRLGIPALKVTDGPNGARGDAVSGKTAASFPVGIALAATWNTELVQAVGGAIGQEAISKSAQVVLGPTVNLHRTPLGGRNFECFGEDPLLSGEMAVAFIEGVQAQGVGACVKHFVCNDSEFERHTISSELDERTLREIYLRPFELAVRRARPWCLMSAYNRINGTYAGSHQRLIGDVLRSEWGFDGLVMSDWYAALETIGNVLAGMDLEMPGPSATRGERLLQAVRSGEVPVAVIDACVRRVLRLLERSGRLANPVPLPPEQAVDKPEHRLLARSAAEESMVLIRNQGLLPLRPERIRRLLVVGPNAETGQIQGGGSSSLRPHYQVGPLAGIRQRYGDAAVEFRQGCFNHKYLPVPLETVFTDAGHAVNGMRLLIGDGAGRALVDRRISLRAGMGGAVPLSLLVNEAVARPFDARLTGSFRARLTGDHQFGLLSAGRARLLVDGRVLIDNWTSQEPGDALFGRASSERRAGLRLAAGQTCALEIEFQDTGEGMSGLRLGLLEPVAADLQADAVQAARDADAVIVVAGSNADWETEGNDRADLRLPGPQDALIQALVRANPRTVVVLNTGGAMAMPWLEQAGAVLQAWLPGQEFGHALARILAGDASPCGRMPTTFPRRLEDTPGCTSYPGEQGRVYYGERVFMGYRWYDQRDIEPLVAFGHGLSYSRFDYGEPELPATVAIGEAVEIRLTLTNVGDMAAKEVVQVYVGGTAGPVQRAPQQLAAFLKVGLAPGEARALSLRLPPEAFRYWDATRAGWWTSEGEYELRIGASSREIRQVCRVRLRSA